MPFRLASWLQRTSVPGLTAQLNGGHVAPDGKTYVTCTPSFFGSDEIPQMNAIHANMAYSPDQAQTWFVQNPPSQSALLFPFTITGAPGVNSLRYVRPRLKFSQSFFIANNTIGPGFLALDISDDGSSWNEVQKLYEWPHLIGGGGSSQAQVTHLQVVHVFLEGTGPNGADRDWILVRLRVSSPLATPVDDHAWWYSDNFGYSWTRDRTETGSIAGVLLSSQIGKSLVPGRLIATTGSNPHFSTDNGVTWQFGGGFLPATFKQNLMHQQGNTWVLLQAGGLASACTVGLSCDDGATWQSGPTFGPSNTNPNGLRLGPTELLAWCRDSDTVPTGVNEFYSTDGGETLDFQYKETRISALQSSVIMTGFYPNGAPMIVGIDGVVLVSNDRPTGDFKQRSTCPLAFAGVAKAGPPDLCGHPMMQNRC